MGLFLIHANEQPSSGQIRDGQRSEACSVLPKPALCHLKPPWLCPSLHRGWRWVVGAHTGFTPPWAQEQSLMAPCLPVPEFLFLLCRCWQINSSFLLWVLHSGEKKMSNLIGERSPGRWRPMASWAEAPSALPPAARVPALAPCLRSPVCGCLISVPFLSWI